MLHIHNGDASADVAKQTSLPGEHFAFREALIAGPVPAGVEGAEWMGIRAKHLAESYGMDVAECETELRVQEEKLETCSQHNEVVLWFEHDLFCQLHLIFLLRWFAVRNFDFEETKVSLICIGAFPGKMNFRGLGELTSEQLASLFPSRKEISRSQLALATDAWQAYSSTSPRDLEDLLNRDTSPLQFLDSALRAHLARFPSKANGLGEIENTALTLVSDGTRTFPKLFNAFNERHPVYGLGDAQFWLALQPMIHSAEPLLSPGGTNERGPLTPEFVSKATFSITETGKRVLKSEKDFVSLNGLDQWLGGVHLRPDNMWRWDKASGRVSK